MPSTGAKFVQNHETDAGREPPALVSIVGKIRVPVLLIASNKPGELTDDQIYRDRIGANATLWSVSDAGHVEALETHPHDYTARVTAFSPGRALPDQVAVRRANVLLPLSSETTLPPKDAGKFTRLGDVGKTATAYPYRRSKVSGTTPRDAEKDVLVEPLQKRRVHVKKGDGLCRPS